MLPIELLSNECHVYRHLCKKPRREERVFKAASGRSHAWWKRPLTRRRKRKERTNYYECHVYRHLNNTWNLNNNECLALLMASARFQKRKSTCSHEECLPCCICQKVRALRGSTPFSREVRKKYVLYWHKKLKSPVRDVITKSPRHTKKKNVLYRRITPC